jgi:hypothetical protein
MCRKKKSFFFRFRQLKDMWLFPKISDRPCALTSCIIWGQDVGIPHGKLATGLKLPIHYHPVLIFWIYGAKPHNTNYLCAALNPLDVLVSPFFKKFLWIYTLFLFPYRKIVFTSFKLIYYCRKCSKNCMQNFWLFWPNREWNLSVNFVCISKK